jgi:hypothetical protein
MSGCRLDCRPSRIEEECQLRADIAEETISVRSKFWILSEVVLIDHSSHHFVGLDNLNLAVGIARVYRDRSAGRVRERPYSTIFEQDNRRRGVVCRGKNRERSPDT